MAANHEGTLGAVYSAKLPGEVAALYNEWAERYDAEMATAGYRHPSICLSLLARHLPRGAAPILDAGAGTGLVGEWLGIIGYPHVEALDISPGMLEVARRKGVYRALHCLTLGEALPFADEHFAGIVSAGVFTTGHVGVEGLGELIRICRKGGIIVLTVKNTLWDDSFRAYVEEMERKGGARRIEETEPYISMPGEAGTIPSRAVVLGRF